MKIVFLIATLLVLSCNKFSAGGGNLNEIAKKRGLSPKDMEAALMTYTPSGVKDPYILFSSGGHSGNINVIGLPSMRFIKEIPVFSPNSWQGWGTGSKGSEEILNSGGGNKLRWGDTHHPANSETNGSYDGQYLFINDKANARIAVIDLQDFVTKQIVKNPLFVNDHGGAFVTPNTEYIMETSQYNTPLGGKNVDLDKWKDEYRGAVTMWKFDRALGKIDQAKSFSIELPPYWQDIADSGKLESDGYFFINSINTELATGDNLKGKANFEVSVSKNDMDLLHVINWKKAAEVVGTKPVKVINGMRVIPLQTAISEGLLYFITEPKSPHGVDVSPNGNYIVVAGKLDPHVTIFNFTKIREAIKNSNFQGKDPYGVPILKFDAVMEAQVELGLGPLHTQFDKNGFAYTSLFLDSAIAKWSLGPPYHSGNDAWKLKDKVQVNYNIGHLTCIEGDTVTPGEGYCVALNKWALDRFNPVGPLVPQNFQLVDTASEKMRVLYDLPIPNAEPHYAQIMKADRLKPIEMYEVGTDPTTMKESPFATFAGDEKIVRKGKTVEVFMTVLRSHVIPDKVEVNKGDTVRMHLTSLEQAFDATHGFAIGRYNINLSLEPGKVETVEFVANESGVFPYYCTEFCSALHLEMAGYLLVN
jgi:nitrous-oxide reductase